MAETAVNVNMPGPPVYEQSTSTTGPTTGEDVQAKTLSPEQIAARDAQRAQTAEEIKATDAKRALDEKAAKIGVQDVELQQFADEASRNILNGPEARAANDLVVKARDYVQREGDRLAKMPPPALFADGQGWSNVRKAVGMALAGLGDGMIAAAMIRAGHAPSNRNTVAQIIDADLARQRAAIDRQKDSVLMARTGLRDAQEARAFEMAKLELKAKNMYRQAELLTRQRLANLKMEQPAIEQTKEILEAKRRQADHDVNLVQGLAKVVTNRWDSSKTTSETTNRVPGAGGSGGGVEAAKGSVNYNLFKEHGAWLRDNLPNLSEQDRKDVGAIFKSAQFFDKNTSLTALMAGAGIDREKGMSSVAKEFIARAREAADAKGRIKSGGAINLGEEQRFIAGVTPEISDKAKDIQMRQGIIDTDIRVMSPLDRTSTAAPTAGGTPTPAAEVPVPKRGPSQAQYAAARSVLEGKAKGDKARARVIMRDYEAINGRAK